MLITTPTNVAISSHPMPFSFTRYLNVTVNANAAISSIATLQSPNWQRG